MVIKKIDYINVKDEIPDSLLPVDLVLYIEEDGIKHVLVAFLDNSDGKENGVFLCFHSLYSYVRFTGNIRFIYEEEIIRKKLKKKDFDEQSIKINYDSAYSIKDMFELSKNNGKDIGIIYKSIIYLLTTSEEKAEKFIKKITNKDTRDIRIPHIDIDLLANSSDVI